jgi:hypothetical protein
MATAVVFNPAAIEDILAAVDGFFEDTLGPDISEDAQRLCPVFGGENSTATAESIAASPNADPGALRDSIEYHLNGHDLIVSATGSDERSYAYYVERGHRVWAWGRPMGYEKGPQPFLSPALYSVRSY